MLFARQASFKSHAKRLFVMVVVLGGSGMQEFLSRIAPTAKNVALVDTAVEQVAHDAMHALLVPPVRLPVAVMMVPAQVRALNAV